MDDICFIIASSYDGFTMKAMRDNIMINDVFVSQEDDQGAVVADFLSSLGFEVATEQDY